MYAMRHRLIALLGLLSCVLGGCGDRHTDRRITADDVVGTWRMTPQSLALLKDDGYTPAADENYTVTFFTNGTLKFASVLPEFRGGHYVATTGTWALKHDVPVDNEILRTNCLEVNWGRNESANFAYENGKLILWTWYGDPDLNAYIDYVRE